MKELRIFIVEFDEWDRHRFEFDVEGGLLTMSDEDFMTVAEGLGTVYSLDGFQEAWAMGDVPMCEFSAMRIINIW